MIAQVGLGINLQPLIDFLIAAVLVGCAVLFALLAIIPWRRSRRESMLLLLIAGLLGLGAAWLFMRSA